jgi:hypothetical protein
MSPASGVSSPEARVAASDWQALAGELDNFLHGFRTALYPHLARLANEWNGRMGIDERYPDNHASFLERCHDAGQTRPTPLLLQYVPGDYNWPDQKR